MNLREHLAIPAEHWSRLKIMAESPKHYRYACDHESLPTDAMNIGSYVHTAVLEPARLDGEYAIWDGRRQGKAWDAFCEQNEDKTILRATDVAEAQEMIEALRANTFLFDLLSDPDTVVEDSIFWLDGSGTDCKARPDIRNRRLKIVVDLKTSKSTDIRKFGFDIVRFLYHGQLAFYSDGIEAAEGWTPEAHVLIVVEKSPPYDVAVFPLSVGAITVGRELYRNLLGQLRECIEASHWPGRHPKPVELNETNLPPWIYGGGAPEIAFIEEP